MVRGARAEGRRGGVRDANVRIFTQSAPSNGWQVAGIIGFVKVDGSGKPLITDTLHGVTASARFVLKYLVP